MIVVFAEFGGEELLGKAREIADSLGLRVLAVCSSEHETDDFYQRQISLGADEVMKYDSPKNVFEWTEVLSSLLKNQAKIRFLFAISGLIADAILGRVYALAKDRVASFGTGVDSFAENVGIKNLRSWGASLLLKADIVDKANIFSFKPCSVPELFEDSSRYGKISETKVKSLAPTKSSPKTIGLEKQDYRDSEGILTILLGKTIAKREAELKAAERVASKYKGIAIIQSSKVEDIYGPCLAIDVSAAHEAELPRFHRELISMNSSEDQVISRMADTNAVTEDLPLVLEEVYGYS